MNAVFCSPSRYTQGPNATEKLGEEMKTLGLGGPVLIVAGRSARSQLEVIWQQTLGRNGIEFTVHPFAGECTDSEIAFIVSAARAGRVSTIIGAGGA